MAPAQRSLPILTVCSRCARRLGAIATIKQPSNETKPNLPQQLDRDHGDDDVLQPVGFGLHGVRVPSGVAHLAQGHTASARVHGLLHLHVPLLHLGKHTTRHTHTHTHTQRED